MALCTRERRGPGLRFVQGDAQALPFPDACFDAVVDVESSHCYGSMAAFLTEVHRVLRPGGDLFWADLRARAAVPLLREQLAASGLAVRAEEDLTAGVLEAVRLDDERKLALIDAWIPWAARAAFRPFAGIQGTRNHAGFASGELRYLGAWLARPDLPRRAAAQAGSRRAADHAGTARPGSGWRAGSKA